MPLIRSGNFGDPRGTVGFAIRGQGRGGDSSEAAGNFEVFPLKNLEIRGGDGDK